MPRLSASGALVLRLALAFASLALAVLAGVLAPHTSLAQAQQAAPDFSTRARQAILMDAGSGAVLFQQNADVLTPPASMSKLMALAVIFRKLKLGEIKPTDPFLVTEDAWRRGGAPSGTSAMMVPVGTSEPLSELLLGIVVQSGNDASIALAEGIGGNERGFARLMTEEARRIGLVKSTFENATGLYSPGHLMTARELAVLARHLIAEYPEQYALFAQKEFQYRRHKFFNRNPLLGQSGIDGLKTGFIKEAGYGMVASAKQGDRRLIAVVNGLATAEERKAEAQRLIDWGFRGFAEFTLFNADEVVAQARVWGGDRFFVPLTGNGPVYVMLPRSASNQRLRAEVVYSGPLKPPIRKGDAIARLRVTTAGNATSEVQLYAAEDVEPSGIWRRGLDSLAHLALRWVPL